MAYCKDLESLSKLPPLPADLQVTHRHSASMSSTHPNNTKNSTPITPRGGPTPSPSLPIARSESVPEPGTSSRQSSPMPSSSEKRDKMFPFRGSTTGDKIANRKSTPEFDRKQSPSVSSNDGSVKAKKVCIFRSLYQIPINTRHSKNPSPKRKVTMNGCREKKKSEEGHTALPY